MPAVVLFAQAREAAGTSSTEGAGSTVADVIGDLCDRFGPHFADVVAVSRVWLNGEPAEQSSAVGDADEIAVLPPVSGG